MFVVQFAQRNVPSILFLWYQIHVIASDGESRVLFDSSGFAKNIRQSVYLSTQLCNSLKSAL